MDGISRSRGWDKDIPHCVLPMEQLVLSDKWARKIFTTASLHWDHSILYALVCGKEISHMCKNNGNPDLVCEK